MRSLLVVASFAVAAPAAADDAVHASASAPAPPSRHLVYAELLGKGGLYGIGYEHSISSRLAFGAAGSFAIIRDQQLYTFAPYLHAKLVRGKRHALFGELGAILAHMRVPSPVEDWDGMADTGSGGFASLGWERATRHLVLRASGSLVVGEGGWAPMVGFAVGARP